MPCDVTNINVGPCDVTFDAVDVGLTKGGVVVSVSVDSVATNDNQFGTVQPDLTITSRSIKVKTPLIETDFDNLKIALLGGTVHTVNAAKERLDVYEGSGTTMFQYAGQLILKPRGIGVTANDWITVPKAIVVSPHSLTYKTNKERILEIEFTGMTDITDDKLFYFGDITA